MMRIVTAACAALVIAAPAAAQNAASFFARTTFSGYVDTYYAYNLNRPATPCQVVNGVEVFNCLHAFDVVRNGFSLNLVDLGIDKTPTGDSRGGFHVDLSYGAGELLVAGAESGRHELPQNLQQAYVSYLASERGRVRLDFGKFVTPAGFERIDPSLDWNGSRSLLFALAIPRDHFGLRAVFAPADWITVMGLVTNGWRDVADNAGARRAGVSVSVRPAKAVTVTETYLTGPETSISNTGWRDLSDTVVVARIADGLSVAFNADVGRDRSTLQEWDGAALYVHYQMRDWFSITPRVESLRDHDGFMTGVAQDLQEGTITAEFKPAPAGALRLEYRVDVTDRPYFLRGASNTVRTQSIASATWVIVFNSHG